MADRTTTILSEGFLILPLVQTNPKAVITINSLNITPDFENLNFTLETNGVSGFNIILDNSNGKYIDAFKPGQTVNIGLDYEDGSNTKLIGKIDNPSIFSLTSSGWTCQITGRDFPELEDDVLSIDFDVVNGNTAFNSVITSFNSAYANRISAGSIPTTSISINYKFRDIPYIEILRYIAKKCGWDFRISTAGVITAFEEGTTDQYNYDESIISGDNMTSCSNFGRKYSEVKNFIKGYGTNSEGCMTLWTSKDQDSINETWKKVALIQENSADSNLRIKDRTDKEINKLKDAEKKGSLGSLGIDTLLPGQSLYCFVFQADVNGFLIAKRITHNYGPDGWDTYVELNEKEIGGLELFNEISDNIQSVKDYQNPNNMQFSYNFKFKSSENILS